MAKMKLEFSHNTSCISPRLAFGRMALQYILTEDLALVVTVQHLITPLILSKCKVLLIIINYYNFSLFCFTKTNCAVCLSLSDDSQEAFELYYSETYSESSSVSLQDSHRSLASTSDGGDSNPTLMLMQEYMITVSVYNLHHHHHKRKNLTLINCHLTRFMSFKSLPLRWTPLQTIVANLFQTAPNLRWPLTVDVFSTHIKTKHHNGKTLLPSSSWPCEAKWFFNVKQFLKYCNERTSIIVHKLVVI